MLRILTEYILTKAEKDFLSGTIKIILLSAVKVTGRVNRVNAGMNSGIFNKWGITGSMLSAMILNDMICGKKNQFAELFSPSRSILKPQLFVNGFEALRNMLTLSAKRCTHLGCALKWNSSEHSWDCACHGSRFDENGHILENPANKDL